MSAHNRIHIIGGPGSGKTTLANQLVARLGAPVYDLDIVAFEGGAGARRPLDLCLADVQRILAQPCWVTEGIYLWWTDDLLRAAEHIIWLDPPWRVAAWRIVLRHVRAELAGHNRHRGWLKLLRFVRWTRTYYARKDMPTSTNPEGDGANCRVATAVYLQAYMDKVIHCRDSDDVQRFLNSERRGRAGPPERHRWVISSLDKMNRLV